MTAIDMAFHTDDDIYDELPIPSDALERGGVEMLRAGVVDDELFVTARRALADPSHWGYVLADITRRLAMLYAAETDVTEAKVCAAVARTYAAALASANAGPSRKPAKRGTSRPAPTRAKARAKLRPTARRRRARPKP